MVGTEPGIRDDAGGSSNYPGVHVAVGGPGFGEHVVVVLDDGDVVSRTFGQDVFEGISDTGCYVRVDGLMTVRGGYGVRLALRPGDRSKGDRGAFDALGREGRKSIGQGQWGDVV